MHIDNYNVLMRLDKEEQDEFFDWRYEHLKCKLCKEVHDGAENQHAEAKKLEEIACNRLEKEIFGEVLDGEGNTD